MNKLTQLRSLMKENNIAVYIVPSEDPHQSEYVADYWKRREFISNFSGSAGTVVVTDGKALLWTDGRYYLQAEQELDGSSWTLMKSQEPTTPTTQDWIIKEFASTAAGANKSVCVGIDPFTCSTDYARTLEYAFETKNANIKLTPINNNLVDAIWTNRPPAPSHKVVMHPLKYAGCPVSEKLEKIRKEMVSVGASYLLLTALDQIAWTLNIRGGDVACNPVVVCNCLIQAADQQVLLFVDSSKIHAEDTDLQSHLRSNHIDIRPYESTYSELSSAAMGKKVWIDSASCSYGFYNLLLSLHPTGTVVHMQASPVVMLMAIKNEVEIEGFRRSHIRDGVALVGFFAWLNQIAESNRLGEYTEYSIATKLEEFRMQQDLYMGPSFDTISAFGPNGAIVHYRPSPANSSPLTSANIYLVDSGGQYLDGTTDVTRTIALGTPTPEQKNCFTCVLKGHIALDAQVFPSGINGYQLDLLARTALWNEQLDYSHGTGHGVGSYLCVHEGPHGISKVGREGRTLTPLRIGMTVTDEPGYYKAGAFGIRIENVMVVQPAPDKIKNGGGGGGESKWLRFEKVTMCPIDKKLIEIALLTPNEIAWIDAYHQQILRSLSPHLHGHAREFLVRQCAPLSY